MVAHVHNTDTAVPAAPFQKALVIGLLFMSIELLGGWIANSLALVTDALHLSTDVGSLALALIILKIVALPKNQQMSFGYQRAEILGALASALFLIALCVFLIYEAIERFIYPSEVNGGIILFVATIGLLANIWMVRILHPIHHDDLNAKAAYLHVVGDLLASIGVVLGGLLIWLTAWNIIDPIITIMISLAISYSSINIIRKTIKILMQAAPEGINPVEVEQTLLTIPGVKEIHDLHIWAVSSKRISLSAHIIAESSQTALQAAHKLIEEKYHIHYMTIQVEEPEKFESRFCYDAQSKGEKNGN